MKINNRNFFTVIELVAASTLTLIMFAIIGYVFGTVAKCTSKLNDKISEGLSANKFFSQLADDFGASYPVFYLGDKSDGFYLNIVTTGNSNPFYTLPGGYSTKGISGVLTKTGLDHREFLRCITTNQENGGILNFSGVPIIDGNPNINHSDKPVRYVSYIFTGASPLGPVGGSMHERSVYRMNFPLRPDNRKNDNTIRGGYSAGTFVQMGYPGDGDKVAQVRGDQDVRKQQYLSDVWEIRTEFLETSQNDKIGGFGDKVLMKVSVEFAFVDASKAYGDPLRFSRYPIGDMDGNAIPDYKEHTFTTVIVVNRNNLDNK